VGHRHASELCSRIYAGNHTRADGRWVTRFKP
jgi:hypothetical protein